MVFIPTQLEVDEKAGYNQAGEITKLLSLLRTTFISSMIKKPNDYDTALEACRGVLNIISGKVKPEIIEEFNGEIYKIEQKMHTANETYRSERDGHTYYKNIEPRIELKKELENLWRQIEETQDTYGYGMFSEDDSGL